MSLIRQEEPVEGDFLAKSQNNHDGKNKKTKQNNKLGGSAINIKNNRSSNTQEFPPCPYWKKKTITHKKSVGKGLMHNVSSVVS